LNSKGVIHFVFSLPSFANFFASLSLFPYFLSRLCSSLCLFNLLQKFSQKSRFRTLWAIGPDVMKNSLRTQAVPLNRPCSTVSYFNQIKAAASCVGPALITACLIIPPFITYTPTAFCSQCNTHNTDSTHVSSVSSRSRSMLCLSLFSYYISPLIPATVTLCVEQHFKLQWWMMNAKFAYTYRNNEGLFKLLLATWSSPKGRHAFISSSKLIILDLLQHEFKQFDVHPLTKIRLT
jgi:hypothetical protein